MRLDVVSEFPYKHSTGETIGRFLAGLKEQKRIWGQRVAGLGSNHRLDAASPFIPPDRRRGQVLDGQVEEPFHFRGLYRTSSPLQPPDPLKKPSVN